MLFKEICKNCKARIDDRCSFTFQKLSGLQMAPDDCPFKLRKEQAGSEVSIEEKTALITGKF